MRRFASPGFWGALALLGAAGALALYGEPDLDTRWNFLEPEYGPRLAQRDIYIDPGELLDLIQDDYIKLHIVDVRPEADWNLFHLKFSERIPIDGLPRHRKQFSALPSNGVIVLVSNGEVLATAAWKRLIVMTRANAYVLEGGLNNWLDAYGSPDSGSEIAIVEGIGQMPPAQEDTVPSNEPEALKYDFHLAIGDRHPAAFPDPQHMPRRTYDKKVKFIKTVIKKGGCG